jgi:hypothetical protein
MRKTKTATDVPPIAIRLAAMAKQKSRVRIESDMAITEAVETLMGATDDESFPPLLFALLKYCAHDGGDIAMHAANVAFSHLEPCWIAQESTISQWAAEAERKVKP